MRALDSCLNSQHQVIKHCLRNHNLAVEVSAVELAGPPQVRNVASCIAGKTTRYAGSRPICVPNILVSEVIVQHDVAPGERVGT